MKALRTTRLTLSLLLLFSCSGGTPGEPRELTLADLAEISTASEALDRARRADEIVGVRHGWYVLHTTTHSSTTNCPALETAKFFTVVWTEGSTLLQFSDDGSESGGLLLVDENLRPSSEPLESRFPGETLVGNSFGYCEGGKCETFPSSEERRFVYSQSHFWDPTGFPLRWCGK
jgi:hypothetical protein